MNSGNNRTSRKLLQVATTALALVAMLGGFAVLTSARQSGAAQAAAPQPKPRETRRGTITGTVTADQGKVVAFRVQAHNLDLQLWYTVFTNKGHYIVPQALPGEYEMFVDMGTYDSPRTALQLAAGETKTADFAIKKKKTDPPSAGGEEGATAGKDPAKIEYVSSMEDMYPPGPALDLLKANCIGCHAETFSNFGHYHLDKAGYLKGIEHMTETGPGYNALCSGAGPHADSPSSRRT